MPRLPIGRRRSHLPHSRDALCRCLHKGYKQEWGSITVEIPYARTVLSDGVNVTQISVSRSDEYFFFHRRRPNRKSWGSSSASVRTGEERGTEIRLTVMLPYVYMSVARAANDFPCSRHRQGRLRPVLQKKVA